MEDTCRGETCWIYLLMKDLLQSTKALDFKDCPFYQEMIFTPTPIGEKVGTARLIKDCTSKRGLLFMLQEMYPRLLGVQESNEQMRNKTEKATSVFNDFFNESFRLLGLPKTDRIKILEIEEGKRNDGA